MLQRTSSKRSIYHYPPEKPTVTCDRNLQS